MNENLMKIAIVIASIIAETVTFALVAFLMAATVFVAWSVVLHPVLGLPALTLSQIFICAAAFLSCIAISEQVRSYFNVINFIEEERKDEEDSDKKH